MTLGDLVKDLKNRVGPGVEVTDDGLAVWINASYMYMVDEIIKVDPDFFTTSATAPLVADQQEYELPDDCDKVMFVNLLIDGQWVRATPLPTGAGDIDNFNNPTGQTISAPRYYLQNGKIGFTPIPATSATAGLDIHYVYTPLEMTSSGEPAFSHKYHSIANIGAYADYLDQNDEHGAADATRNRFEKRVASMIETIDDSDLDSPKSVVVTRNSDLYAEVDTI